MPSFYIAPNSDIRLLRDIPIDQAQEHTLWFANDEAQANYFISKTAASFSKQYYTRQNRGVIKLEATADAIYDCNYMMYRNTAFGNKWFYAFITSIEYTNNNTATITFKIDQLQTWFFQMVLGESFVEREHALYDDYADNLIPENLETGEFIYTRERRDNSLDTMCIVIASTIKLNQAETDFEDAEGFALDGMYSGLSYYYQPFNATGIQNINNFLLLATNKGKAESIVSVFMAPQLLMSNVDYSTSLTFDYEYLFRPSEIDGYTPRNNKLLTSPYSCIVVKTPTNMGEFAWEYFKYPLQPTFEITGNASTSPALMLTPKQYKTSTNGEVNKNYIESMTLDGFPQCSYTIDAYKAWLAQNGPSLLVNGALAATALGASLMTYGASDIAQLSTSQALAQNWSPPWLSGNSPYNTEHSPGGIGVKSGVGLVGSLGTIGNILAQIHAHAILPPHAMGNADGSISLTNKLMNFIFYTRTIRREYAEIIDEYFDKFGYATHRIKVPNIHARTYWTYTKTVDCIIHGNLPTEAIDEIQSIFNKGVTFWADPSVVGQYSTYASANLPLGA